jgi:hypothetical protein
MHELGTQNRSAAKKERPIDGSWGSHQPQATVPGHQFTTYKTCQQDAGGNPTLKHVSFPCSLCAASCTQHCGNTPACCCWASRLLAGLGRQYCNLLSACASPVQVLLHLARGWVHPCCQPSMCCGVGSPALALGLGTRCCWTGWVSVTAAWGTSCGGPCQQPCWPAKSTEVQIRQ